MLTLPITVTDQHKFHRWSESITSADPSGWRMLTVIPDVVQFVRYIRKLVQTKRDAPRDDLISALVQAEEAGDTLNEDELVAIFPSGGASLNIRGLRKLELAW